jgi:hypothetical protein
VQGQNRADTSQESLQQDGGLGESMMLRGHAEQETMMALSFAEASGTETGRTDPRIDSSCSCAAEPQEDEVSE